jgi:hypothetical protein
MVEECVLAIRDEQLMSAISTLRQQAEALAIDPVELKFVQQRFHQPTLDLRQGGVYKNNTGVVHTTLEEIGKELEALRL